MTYSQTRQHQAAEGVAIDARIVEEVARALHDLRYGSVELTVHDGKVTQIEARKKIRF